MFIANADIVLVFAVLQFLDLRRLLNVGDLER